MGSKICMNGFCGASSSVEWRKGWLMRSGELASLCDKCGIAYEQLAFCDVFHAEETGWRECSSCAKRLHCGCLASSSFIELLDSGGIHCINCKKRSESRPATSDEKPKVFGMSIENSVGETQSSSMENQMSGENNGQRLFIQPQNENNTVGSMKQEEFLAHHGELGIASLSSILNQVSTGSSNGGPKPEINTATTEGMKDVYLSPPVQTNLTISLAPPPHPLRNPNFHHAEEIETSSRMISSSQLGSRSRHLLPKAPSNTSTLSQIRVARPPVEGRVKNQLLPRYWPRITEQELQKISGDSNATVVPLFEKVLSASDAGRIGRLVLPKACAEAYFPPISQPEGLPLRIQDVKGKEWVFQFRFWPNNNSRMYVLEGVTPCIQSMQLQAGDTVTFSRMDPEGKLLMGFRKASNTIPLQDMHVVSAMHNGGGFSSERGFFQQGVVENLPIMSGYSGLFQSLRGSTDPTSVNALSKHLGSSPNGDIGPMMLSQPTQKKRSRNIGSKSKRLLIDSQDALELKLTWEEVQDMLRPPLSVKPSTVTIEDQEFEEYDDPPVMGKSSIFTARISGIKEQWTPCDNCSKWRRLPADFLIPPKWTCQDNIWDQSRCSCSAPDELSSKELEILLKMNKEYKKRRIGVGHKAGEEHEPPTPMDNNASEVCGSTSVAATTKHPRHRPGCSCIVCIQPPSGKGKHKPTCTCNVCMTVKRRFKTLMMRKKKRQSEREAEVTAQRNNSHQFTVWGPKEEESEVDSISRQVSPLHVDPSENEPMCELQVQQANDELAVGSGKGEELGSGKGEELDLNCRPHREVDSQAGSTTRVSMMRLFKVANLPLETYLKQNGLTSLICEQQLSSGSLAVPQPTGESDGQIQERSREEGQEENFEPAEIQNSPS